MLFPPLQDYIDQLPEIGSILPPDRKAKLIKLSQYLQEQLTLGQAPQLIFICTHNSRRSHMGQAWAQIFAWKHQLNMTTYSGGTEATAFNPNAIQALREAGMRIDSQDESENPHYTIQAGQDLSMEHIFSKKFGDSPNPTSDFVAIMTCTDADEACPFVPGASARFSLPYEDPKKFDGSPQQAEKYTERSRQIAAEMKFVMEQVQAGAFLA